MKNLFNKLTTILFILFIILSFKIINLNYDINFANNEYLNNIFNYTFNYNNLFKNNNHNSIVNNSINYIKENDKYITVSNSIYSIKEGLIYLENNKIIIKQIDTFNLILEGEFNTFVFDGDYVNSSSIIGEYYEPFLIYFTKGNKVYTYEEYIRNYL